MPHIDALITAYTRAKAFAAAAESVELAKLDLDDAYRQWKRRNGINFTIAKGGASWNAMMLATAPSYRALTNAKARERRAKKKLLQAVEGA
ncbi:MAG: hypothetical protein RR928_16295 [Comamonas sp.]|uniref:hypothetical protein n=1 Tax=Comamonas sp. TaxID=34028 RepID=UPI002FC81BDD